MADRQTLALKIYQMPCEIHLITLIQIHLFLLLCVLCQTVQCTENLWHEVMLKTPSCCCLALDVLAGKDLLKSSFIADIPSSHNSFLKTLTGIIMQGSPQDAVSYTRGAAWPRARQGEGVSVLVCLLSFAIAWPILKHQLQCASSRQRFHSSVKFLHSSLSERTIPN